MDADSWHAKKAQHEARVDAWITPHLERRSRGLSHPVEDFLFTYYSYPPAALRRWHPGFGVTLTGAGTEIFRGVKGYDVSGDRARVDPRRVAERRAELTAIRNLLLATERRPPALRCFGLHEWAMVYRLDQDEVRHAAWPLRLGTAGTDEVVGSHRVACSHFDAFRFFTDAARPRNLLQPAGDDRAEFEQPGCLHAGMDLYKHAYRLTPMVPSELVADCFELARDIRVLDMRASPYDLSDLGYSPVRVETPEGKQEYVTAQRAFAERAAPLRQQLINKTARLLAVDVP